MHTRSTCKYSIEALPDNNIHVKRHDFLQKKRRNRDKIYSIKIYKKNTVVGYGLKNLGNTCYMNSVLQCLMYLPPLKNYIDLSEHLLNCKSKGVCFLCEFIKILKLAQKLQQIKNFAVIPENFLHCITVKNNSFVRGRQQDAHELLLFLISMMESSEKSINNIFSGTISSQILCGKCNNISSTIERFNDVSLDISNSDTLNGCIKNFCSIEELKGENKYFCEKCRKKINSKKQLIFSERKLYN